MSNLKPMFVLLFCLVVLAGLARSIEAKPIVKVLSKEIHHRLYNEEAFVISVRGLDEDGNECSRSEPLPVGQYFPNSDFYPGPYYGEYSTHLIYREGDDCYVAGYSELDPYLPTGSVFVHSTLMLDWGFDIASQEFYVDIDPARVPMIATKYVEHLTEEMVIDSNKHHQPAGRFPEKLSRAIEDVSDDQNPKPMVSIFYEDVYHWLDDGVYLIADGLDEDGEDCSRWFRLPPDKFFPNADLYPGPFRTPPYSTRLIYRDGENYYVIGHTSVDTSLNSQDEISFHSTLLTAWGFDLETQEFYIDLDLEKLPKMPSGTVEPFRTNIITEKLIYEKLHGLSGAMDLENLEDMVSVENIW